MALGKVFKQNDNGEDNGITGNYIRCEKIELPNLMKSGWTNGAATFYVYRDAASAAVPLKPIRELRFILTPDFFDQVKTSQTFKQAIKKIYDNKSMIAVLASAADIIDPDE